MHFKVATDNDVAIPLFFIEQPMVTACAFFALSVTWDVNRPSLSLGVSGFIDNPGLSLLHSYRSECRVIDSGSDSVPALQSAN